MRKVLPLMLLCTAAYANEVTDEEPSCGTIRTKVTDGKHEFPAKLKYKNSYGDVDRCTLEVKIGQTYSVKIGDITYVDQENTLGCDGNLEWVKMDGEYIRANQLTEEDLEYFNSFLKQAYSSARKQLKTKRSFSPRRRRF